MEVRWAVVRDQEPGSLGVPHLYLISAPLRVLSRADLFGVFLGSRYLRKALLSERDAYKIRNECCRTQKQLTKQFGKLS